VITAAGLWLGIHGIRKIGFLNRFDKYIRQLNQQMYIPLQNLAERNRKSLDYIKKDLQKMIDQRFFYEGHLDCENNYLILSDEAYSEYQAAKMDSYTRQKEMEQQQESQKLSAECQKLIDEGQAYVKHIRACNDVIPGVEISAKLDRMESLVSRIFDEVRIHPEVAPELQKMMDYYLPTTSKLLDSYRELDAQPISGENISSTKKEIEAAIDTLNIAFEKLLDSLFADRAWDISSDISVLNTMLAQEGLTQKDF
jgi:5-bromo-4-chloroindolyl phosphate hydrolysis protein